MSPGLVTMASTDKDICFFNVPSLTTGIFLHKNWEACHAELRVL